jgi:fumarate reductase subunit D
MRRRTEVPPVGNREPVLNAASIASVVTALVSILVTVGVVNAEDGDKLSNAAGVLIAALVAVVSIVAHIVAAFRARSKVSPVASGGVPPTPLP